MRTLSCFVTLLLATAFLVTGLCSPAVAQKGKATTDPAEADADFAVQGEYAGVIVKEGKEETWGAQVIALGEGKFRAVGYPGGLPGDGWNEKEKKQADGATEAAGTTFKTPDGDTITITGDDFKVVGSSGDALGTLKKVHRKSSTLDAKPPAGAVVLFDGTTAEHFEGGKMTDDGLLMQGCISKQKFHDFKLHLEFLLPYMPAARGQGRGNSGCYLQSRYEVQMLDSFGLEGKQNECGGIYSIGPPRINMCYPPLAWQTYDVDFKAAEYDGDKKVKHARMTVRHNGVVIHDDVELDHATTAHKLKEGPEPGPIYLQNHGNPVRYRNIWVEERKG